MSDNDYRELLTNWLKNIYTVENSLVNNLENQKERAEAFPELQSRLMGHREESQRHADMVSREIDRLGGDVSGVRTQVSKLMGDIQSKFMGAYGDSLARDLITNTMLEQFEISSYETISALASRLGEQQTVDTCNEILEDEKQMHQYLTDNLENFINESYERDLLTNE